jgi:hypothetical protein
VLKFKNKFGSLRVKHGLFIDTIIYKTNPDLINFKMCKIASCNQRNAVVQFNNWVYICYFISKFSLLYDDSCYCRLCMFVGRYYLFTHKTTKSVSRKIHCYQFTWPYTNTAICHVLGRRRSSDSRLDSGSLRGL